MVLLLLLQDLTAEESFRKLEETLIKAKSMRIRFSVSGTHGEKTGDRPIFNIEGTLVVSREKGLNRQMKWLDRGQEFQDSLVCNSKRMCATFQGQKNGPVDAPPNLNADITGALIKLGVAYPAKIGIGLENPSFDQASFPPVSVAYGADEAGLRSIVYRIPNVRKLGMKARGVIWFDPKTWKLTKRTLRLENAVALEEWQETYQEFSLDVDPPHELFKLD